MVEENQRK